MALTDKLTAIGDAIRSKTGGSDLLTLDEMPQEIQSIQTGGGGGDSEELDTVTITPATITSYETQSSGVIRDYAFAYCTSLQSISCPNVTGMQREAFEWCSSLAEVEFPSVTAVQTAVFQDCEGLVKADFGSVTSFSSAVFRRADNLETLIIRTPSQIATAASTTILANTKIASGTGYIYVPSALLEQYKVATNWATYANQFRAIEDYPEICGDAAANANGEVA